MFKLFDIITIVFYDNIKTNIQKKEYNIIISINNKKIYNVTSNIINKILYDEKFTYSIAYNYLNNNNRVLSRKLFIY